VLAPIEYEVVDMSLKKEIALAKKKATPNANIFHKSAIENREVLIMFSIFIICKSTNKLLPTCLSMNLFRTELFPSHT
jgi:hypothetical protein